MKNSPLFRKDMETRIMDAWHTVTEIEEIYHSEEIRNDPDRLMNALLGVIELGNNRFNLLFEQFEQDLKERWKAKQVSAADRFCDANCVWTDHVVGCRFADETAFIEPDADGK
jgi:DNA-directed RNA polymerase beta subunit